MTQALYNFAQVSSAGLPNNGSADPTSGAIGVITGIVFGITASIALLMIVISGFRYIVAHGDPNATAQAKNTILYAVIGLLVSVTAYSIVIFVIKGLS
jgi:hypothetical protein